MSCPQRAELEAWSQGQLSPEDDARLAAHAAGCPSCRAIIAELGPAAAADPAATVRDGRRPAPAVKPGKKDLGLGPGSVVGRYVIVSELGRGGMGAVFAAYDPQLDRKVAVKLLHVQGSEAMSAADAAARLQREAQALARVAHPNTVAVFDAGTHAGRVFIAMEYLEGKTLRRWARDAEHPWKEKVAVMRAAGAGLKAVHDAGLVHRDFKPGNVVVTDKGEVKVLDFGLARLSATEAARGPRPVSPTGAQLEAFQKGISLETPLTEEGSLSGTPGYIAPELLSGAPATAASDQFAFGVTLFQALYGERPFSGSSFVDYEAALRRGLPAVPPAKAKAPGWLYPIIRRCLEFDAEKRFPTMQALLDALGRDPAEVRKLWAQRGAVAAVAVAAVVVAARLNAVVCPDESEALAQVWSDAVRARLEAHLVPKEPGGEARVKAALDLVAKNARSWAKESRSACLAAGRRGATHLDVLRQECVTRRGQALSILVDALGQADPAVVARSDELADAFLEDTSCAESARLRRLKPDDVAPEHAAMARSLRGRLLRMKALDLLERGTEALQEARAVSADAHDAGLWGFEGEALYRAGHIEYYQGAEVESVRDFGLSLQRSLAAGTDDWALSAGSRLVRRLAAKQGRLEEARQLLAVIDALWLRLGSEPKDELTLLSARQAVLAAEGKHPEVVELGQRRLDICRGEYGEQGEETVTAMVSLSAALWEVGKVSESNRMEEQAIEIEKAVKGPRDSMLTSRYQTLALGLREEGRREEAKAMLEAGLQLAHEVLDANDGTTIDLKLELAHTLSTLDPARALGLADEGVAFYEKGSDSESLGDALSTRAEVRSALGLGPGALADCQRSADLQSDLADPDHQVKRGILTCFAEAREAARQEPAALAAWREAYELKPPPQLPGPRGLVAFGYARTLAATRGDKAKARALAQEALREYGTFPGFTKERAEVEAWLKAH